MEPKEASVAKTRPFEDNIQCPPDNILRIVPDCPKNLDVRNREHLTLDEVGNLMKAAGDILQTRVQFSR